MKSMLCCPLQNLGEVAEGHFGARLRGEQARVGHPGYAGHSGALPQALQGHFTLRASGMISEADSPYKGERQAH
jgi:hypothetical protein